MFCKTHFGRNVDDHIFFIKEESPSVYDLYMSAHVVLFISGSSVGAAPELIYLIFGCRNAKNKIVQPAALNQLFVEKGTVLLFHHATTKETHSFIYIDT